MIRAFLFDLDGVLVDTAQYHYQAWKRLAEEVLGFSFTETQNERLKGVSRMQALDILLEMGGISATEEEKQAWAERKNRWYVEHLESLDENSLLPGAGRFLKDTRCLRIKMALGSASRNARTILSKTGITPFFDAIVDGNMTTRAKPDPEVFLLCAARLNVPPETCVVFEDARAGIEAAQSAGMVTVGIGSPAHLGDAQLVFPSLAATTPQLLLCQISRP